MSHDVKQRKIWADDMGVWQAREAKNPRMLIKWEDIYRVRAYTIDGITEIYRCVDLDWTYGEYVTLHESWQGFAEVMKEIGQRLAGQSDWADRVSKLSSPKEIVELWFDPKVGPPKSK